MSPDLACDNLPDGAAAALLIHMVCRPANNKSRFERQSGCLPFCRAEKGGNRQIYVDKIPETVLAAAAGRRPA